MRKSILVLLVLLVVLISLPLNGKTAFSGTYAINGMNPGVGAYKGTLTIVARGDVYDVHWAIGNPLSTATRARNPAATPVSPAEAGGYYLRPAYAGKRN